MIPAAGWLGTIGSAAIGFTIWALPVAILGSIGASIWIWVQARTHWLAVLANHCRTDLATNSRSRLDLKANIQSAL